ncbi:universal stress protein [Kineococcus aurantiacus]|uniref:Universal stress protein family protein n=1 Tax=Kineococcus aurantiacus TaxID=37633 RepID=A0A7Y9AUL7_9ACTN|nr:universal stress protein [Kineococcus aurantiacus]NYD21786.1 hypothetical protein [Kineococcus aurantiacus]
MRATTVGFSGSGASRRALRWTVQDCAATGRPLHVLLGPAAGHRDLDAVLGEELLRVAGREPRFDVTLTTDDTARALLVAAADSTQLVLGCGRDVAPLGPGTGPVLGAVLPRCPVPVVLVGPQAVLTPARRVVVATDATDTADATGTADAADTATDGAVAAWAADRELPLRLLTTWRARPPEPGSAEAERRHAHLLAAGRHHAARARLSAATHRPVHADVVEGPLADVVPRRLSVGDLLVVAAGAVPDLPVRTLRSPVVLVPPPSTRPPVPTGEPGDRQRVQVPPVGHPALTGA